MLKQAFLPKGQFKIEHYRNGRLIGHYIIPNGITNGGKDNALDVLFGAGTQITSWYIGLISDSGYSALAAADTMASHAGWTEFTNYDESTRVAWSPAAASSQAVSNSTPMTFTMAGSGTLKGIFCVSNSTKSGTSGTLWATALFASDIAVNTSDELKVTYEVSM